jgi:hypothetical protein
VESGSQFRQDGRSVALSNDCMFEKTFLFPFAVQKDLKKFRAYVRILLCSVRTVTWILMVWSWRFCGERSDLYGNIGRRVLFWCWLKPWACSIRGLGLTLLWRAFRFVREYW